MKIISQRARKKIEESNNQPKIITSEDLDFWLTKKPTDNSIPPDYLDIDDVLDKTTKGLITLGRLGLISASYMNSFLSLNFDVDLT